MVEYVPRTTFKRRPPILFFLEDYYWENRKKVVNVVITLYFKRRKTDPNTSHIIQPPYLLHVSIWNATKSGRGCRKTFQKLLVERWRTPCSLEYYKPPNRKGGLGLLSIRKKNKALLAKWIWRYHPEEKALWQNLIKAKYTPTSNKNHPLHLLQKGLGST